mmetsp:Transcript_10209/g.37944  ORF Transcript_10209/g.37944 Transcript_10209/m.37944 type:complete len:132 (+) Transcript_10209:5209-5604(+)
MTVTQLSLPTKSSDLTPILRKYEADTVDPLGLISNDQLQLIQSEWQQLSENGIVTFSILEAHHENKKVEKLQNFKANAHRKMERHPSKAVIVTKVLENSEKNSRETYQTQSSQNEKIPQSDSKKEWKLENR